MTIPSSILFLLIGGAIISIIGALVKSYFKQVYNAIEELKEATEKRHSENRDDIKELEENYKALNTQVANIMGRLGRGRQN